MSTSQKDAPGLRLAVEIKPVNLAVGRAIWNRFGDIRAFAVNIHLKFPFAVVGGILAIPTWEWPHNHSAEPLAPEDLDSDEDLGDLEPAETSDTTDKISTTSIVKRLVRRLQRTRRRETEADAPHLLEAVAVIVYNPDTGTLDPNLPPPGHGLRWDEFCDTLAETYDSRFE